MTITLDIQPKAPAGRIRTALAQALLWLVARLYRAEIDVL